MRTKFPNSKIPHLWMHKLQAYASNSGETFYFRDDTIFSYGSHFPIARHLSDGSIAFTTKSYSITTTRHISRVRCAIPQDTQLWFVPNPGKRANEQRPTIENKIDDLLAKAATARKRGEEWRAIAINKAEQFNGYAKALDDPSYIDTSWIVKTDLTQLRKTLAERQIVAAVTARITQH